MIDHVSIPVRNLEASARFYADVLATIGYERLVDKPGTVGFGKRYPDLWINERPDHGGTSDGVHVCLRTRDVETVRAFHDRAVELGARSDGAPGFRAEYHESYYAAFVADGDGNRLEVVTFVVDPPG